MRDVASALDRFVSSYLEDRRPLTTTFDPEWRSACQEGAPDNRGIITWQPVRQSPSIDFAGLERALEVTLREEIRVFYGRYWSACLGATAEEGELSLIQLWNAADFERLTANLIGHALQKRRDKHPLTVFFANTEPDTGHFISINNDDGRILLEEPGLEPTRQLDDDLGSFLSRLTPSFTVPDLY